MAETFPNFSRLPAELQLHVWGEVLSGPSMHIFDVCFPSRQGKGRSQKALAGREGTALYAKYSKAAFLDELDDVALAGPEVPVARPLCRFDPSVYRLRNALALTSIDAAASAELKNVNVNTVVLPTRGMTVQYDNDSDVLFLRFDIGHAWFNETSTQIGEELGGKLGSFVGASPLAELLATPWSDEMAVTLRAAKRIGLDVSETWTGAIPREIEFEEIVHLACCLQETLEVLYLVDNCPRRCKQRGRKSPAASQVPEDQSLWREINGGKNDGSRAADLIVGVGLVYREVFDLQELGWHESHPTYVFAMTIGDAIRSQQRDADQEVFQGVRVLVVEGETDIVGGTKH